MRDDHSAAAMALRRIATTITSTDKEDYARLRAYLVSLGRLCRDHEIVRAAVLELRRREGRDDERFTQREQATIGPLMAAFERVADAVTSEGALRDPTWQAIQRALQQPARALPNETLGQMLHAARARQLAPIGLDDLTLLERATEQLLDRLNSCADRDPNVAPVVEDLMTIRGGRGLAQKVIETRTLLDYRSIGRAVDRLIQHADAWDAALEPDALVGPPSWQHGLAQDAIVLIDRICDELDFRTVRRFALYRLRVFFEEFEYERLRAMLEDPAAERRREALLQDEMERFLFQEGYFTLTNLEASRGNIDTAVVDRIEKAGVPPILVELKQVTDLHGSARATRAAVASAIETARGEVQRYRGSLASRPQWAGIMPFIVVVHTCIEDLAELERDDVILIDLSASTPSGKRGRRREHSRPVPNSRIHAGERGRRRTRAPTLANAAGAELEPNRRPTASLPTTPASSPLAHRRRRAPHR